MGAKQVKATILMSGGIDSAACAHLLKHQGLAVDAIYIDFGQAAAKPETKAVEGLSRFLGIALKRVSISGGGSFGAGELVGRNALLILAALFLTRGRSEVLALGLHAGTPYYDCTEQFVNSMNRIVSEHTDGRVTVLAPFIDWSKKDVFDYFLSSHLPTHLTYSCEAGAEPPCGKCASCHDRKSLGC